MTRYHQERPDTRPERWLCLALLVATVFVGDWIAIPIFKDLENPHPWEFVGLALLALLALYLLYMLVALLTVRYSLTEDRLILRQWFWRWEVPLKGGLHLHRWRYRWGWSGGAQRDLGVEEIALLPPVWLWRKAGIWVVAWERENGQCRAVAFRPSPELLGLLKDWTLGPG